MKVDLDELDKLSKNAAPAPWREETATYEDSTGAYACGPFHDSDKYEDRDTDTDDDDGEYWWDLDAEKDAKLITAMRNNIDSLVAELRAAREEICAASEAISYVIHEMCDDEFGGPWECPKIIAAYTTLAAKNTREEKERGNVSAKKRARRSKRQV